MRRREKCSVWQREIKRENDKSSEKMINDREVATDMIQ